MSVHTVYKMGYTFVNGVDWWIKMFHFLSKPFVSCVCAAGGINLKGYNFSFILDWAGTSTDKNKWCSVSEAFVFIKMWLFFFPFFFLLRLRSFTIHLRAGCNFHAVQMSSILRGRAEIVPHLETNFETERLGFRSLLMCDLTRLSNLGTGDSLLVSKCSIMHYYH